MKRQVENELGFEISDDQFLRSEARARKKLSSIISQYGDANGLRLTPWYFEELVYEEAIIEKLMEITNEVMRNVLDMEKECQAKSQDTPLEYPYCSMY